MNEKALKTLEYNKIIAQLTDFAGSALGKELCRNLLPSSDLDTIRLLQKETSDALKRIYQNGSLSFSGICDIRGSLKCLEIGSSLGTAELLRICKVLEVCSRVKAYSRHEHNEDLPDSLDEMFDALQPLTPLSSEIRRCILSEEETCTRKDTQPIKLHGQRFFPRLSAGCRYHNEKRSLLYSGKG